MSDIAGQFGFACPIAARRCSKRCAGIELVATLSLAVSLIVAATAVSIGVAHAQPFGAASYRHGPQQSVSASATLAETSAR